VPDNDQQSDQTAAASPDLREVHLLALVRALARQAAREAYAHAHPTPAPNNIEGALYNDDH
jgi:hypothetical protein